MERIGDIVQQHGLNNISTSLMKNCKLLVWLLVAVGPLISADNSLAEVTMRVQNPSTVNASISDGSSGIANSIKELTGLGSINTEVSHSYVDRLGQSGIATSKTNLSIVSLGNGVEFTENVENSIELLPFVVMYADGQANGGVSFGKVTSKAKRITLEIGENVLLIGSGSGQSGFNLWIQDRNGIDRLATDTVMCNFGTVCTRNRIIKPSPVVVVPGKEFFFWAFTNGGSGIGIGELFSGKATYTVKIIEEDLHVGKVSGDNPIQEGPINGRLLNPLVVRVIDDSGDPVPNMQIDWQIYGPPGATGYRVDPFTFTGIDGKAQTTVRLGNKSGRYIITATCSLCASSFPLDFTANAATGCQGLTLDLFPSFPDTIWPTLMPSGSHDNTALVEPKVSSPAPPGGCVVNFDVEPVSAKGHSTGHTPGIYPKDKAGKIEMGGKAITSCTIPEGQVTCRASDGSISPIGYTAPEISGEEKITATLKDTGEKASKSIFTMVPALGPMSSLPFYRLTGQNAKHPDNNYATNDTIFRIQGIAQDYFDLCDGNICNETLGINDMSLPWGGLFDVHGDWKKPHGMKRGVDKHRIGSAVDIDRCAQTLVRQDDLDNIAEERHNGDRIEEPPDPDNAPKCKLPDGSTPPADTPLIHYDFP